MRRIIFGDEHNRFDRPITIIMITIFEMFLSVLVFVIIYVAFNSPRFISVRAPVLVSGLCVGSLFLTDRPKS